VQARTLSRGQRDNLLWINAGIGLLLCLTLVLCAPLVAAVYRNDQLVAVTRALAVVFVINGFATQFRASLTRSLQFKRLALVDVSSPAIGLAVAVGFAVSGVGYWALVFQQISQAAATLVLLVVLSGWLPGRPRRSEPMGGLLRFGWNFVAAQLVNYAANNIDALTIGLRFGPASLGLYNRGFQLVFMPVNQVRQPLSSVAIPVLSRIQDDTRRYTEYICRGQVGLGYSLVAGLGVVISASVPLTRILLGPQWAEVAPILSLLAAAAAFQTLALVGYWIYVSRGLTGSLFRYTVAFVPIKVVCVLAGSHWGVVGVAAGYCLSHALEWPLSLWWLSRAAAFPVRRLVTGALRFGGLASLGCVLGYAVVRATSAAGLGPIVQVLSDVAVTLVVYGVAALVVPVVRRDVRDLTALVSLLRRRRSAAA
jgi:PST family polysaccharide transporter